MESRPRCVCSLVLSVLFVSLALTASLAGQVGTLLGIVRGPDGGPIGGASVRVFDILDAPQLHRGFVDPKPVRTVATGADGRFTLRDLPRAGAMVEIEKPGYFVHTVPFTGDTPSVVATLQPSGFITGVLLDAAGRPVAGRVTVYFEGAVGYRESPTDAEGRFRVNQGWRGRFAVRGSLGPRVSVSSPVFDVPPERVSLQLTAPPGLLVRAVDEAGRPVETFRAVCLWGRRAAQVTERTLPDFVRALGQDSVGGVVRFAGSPEGERGRIVAHAAGFLPADVPVDLARLEPAVRKGETPLQIDFAEGRVVKGRLVDAAGAPLPGVSFALRARTERPAAARVAEPPPLKTGADGSFRLGGVEDGDVDVVFRKDALIVRTLAVRGTGPVDAGEVKAALFDVGGQLVGAPARARVGLRDRNASVFLPSNGLPRHLTERGPEVAVDAEGRFAFPRVPRGRFDLVTILEQPAGPPVEVPLGSHRIRKSGDLGRLRLADHAGRVAGRVTFTHAAVPTGRLLVQLQDPRSPVPGPRALVERDGTFALVAAPAEYKVEVLDLSTGVVLDTGNTVEVTAGAEAKLPLALRLGLVRVRLQRGSARVLSHVSIDSEMKAVPFPQITDLRDARSGLPVAPGTQELTLFLPARPCRIRAWGGPPWMSSGAARDLKDRGVVQVEPHPETSTRVDLVLK